MNETARLTLRVSSEGAKQATQELDTIARRGSAAESSIGSLARSFIGLASAVAAVRALVSNARTFEVLEAGLKTATGSAENAAVAFGAIKDFAASTPYQVTQVTDAFTKLVNYGLTPSERALRSYGDTASALGKDLNQMIEAVADAATGEFERLKEFGIKARKQGEEVSFTFRGVTKTVAFSAKEIEGYLISLGENNFGGAMAERMATVDGALSNLGDSWANFLDSVNKAGFGDLVEGLVRSATTQLSALTDLISSGEVPGALRAWSDGFTSWATDAVESVEAVTVVLASAPKVWFLNWDESLSLAIRAFREFPYNIRASVQLVGTLIYGWVEDTKITFQAMRDIAAAWFDTVVSTVGNVGAAIRAAFDPTTTFDFLEAQQSVATKFFDDVAAALARQVAGRAELSEATSESVKDIGNERAAALASMELQIEHALRLGQAWRRARDERAAASGGKDRLEGFGVAGGGETPAQIKEREQQLKQLDRLRDYLSTEEELLRAAYNERETLLGDARQKELITEQEYQELYRRNYEQHQADLTDIAEKAAMRRFRIQERTNRIALSGLFGFANEAADTFELLAKQSGKAQKAAFLTSKAIAVAQAIVNTELAASRALAEGGAFAGIPLSSLIRATGYASVALIAAQSIAEVRQFEHGGMIPAGRYGITQEAGPELVRGPAVVTSARTTQDNRLGLAAGAVQPVQVVVHNYAGADVDATERETPDGRVLELVIRRAKDAVAADIRTGGGSVARALEGAYNVGRGRA